MVQRWAGRPRVGVDTAIAVAALVWEIWFLVRWRQDSPEHPALRAIGSMTTGLLFVICGVVARHRTPYARMGMVLFVAGACWMAEDAAILEGGGAYRQVGLFTATASTFGFAYVAFAFPTGRLRGRVDRWLMAAVAIQAFVLGPLAELSYSCSGCGWGVSFRASDRLDTAISTTLSISGAATLGVAVLLFAHRWRTATRPERRMVAPFLIACLVIAAASLPKVLVADWNVFGDLLPLTFALAPLAILAGLARVRLVRVGVTSIVRQLDGATSLPQLRDVLRRALGDRTIAIRIWDARSATWHDEDGAPVTALRSSAAAQCTPIDDRDGRPLGALLHDPALSHDPELLSAVVGAIRLALENAALHDEVTAQLARAADAADGERRRVARDLHDGAQQRLVTLMLDVATLQGRLGDSADPEILDLLAAIQGGARGSLTDLRRLVHGLAPATLAEDGLGSAIRELSMGAAVEVTVVDRLTRRLPAPIESGAFLFASEALANVTKHADARAARVLLELAGGGLHLTVSDDGCGGADPTRGSGLSGLRHRVEALGGHMTISSPPGRGTTVALQLPVGEAAPQAQPANAGATGRPRDFPR